MADLENLTKDDFAPLLHERFRIDPVREPHVLDRPYDPQEPLTASAEIESDAPVVLTLAGSVWSQTANHMIGVTAPRWRAGGAHGGHLLQRPEPHRAVVPVIAEVTLDIGSHTFSLEPMNAQTTSDTNDFFRLTVQY